MDEVSKFTPGKSKLQQEMDDKQEHPSQGSRLLRLPVEVRLIILSHIFGWRVTPYHPTLEDTPEKHLHTQTRACAGQQKAL